MTGRDACSIDYTGGIYEYKYGLFAGNHLVSIIGYDDTQGYWICKNSWGTSWGENGFFRIKYGECGIDSPGSCAYFESCSKSLDLYMNPYPIQYLQGVSLQRFILNSPLINEKIKTNSIYLSN